MSSPVLVQAGLANILLFWAQGCRIPSKFITPGASSPVPRRAAVRNATRTGVAVSPKLDETQGGATLRGVEESAVERGDMLTDEDVGEEKHGG